MDKGVVKRFRALPFCFSANHFGPILNFRDRMKLTKNILGLTLSYKTRAKRIKRNVANHRTHRSSIVDHMKIVFRQAVTELDIFATKAKYRIEHPVFDKKL